MLGVVRSEGITRFTQTVIIQCPPACSVGKGVLGKEQWPC